MPIYETITCKYWTIRDTQVHRLLACIYGENLTPIENVSILPKSIENPLLQIVLWIILTAPYMLNFIGFWYRSILPRPSVYWTTILWVHEAGASPENYEIFKTKQTQTNPRAYKTLYSMGYTSYHTVLQWGYVILILVSMANCSVARAMKSSSRMLFMFSNILKNIIHPMVIV